MTTPIRFSCMHNIVQGIGFSVSGSGYAAASDVAHGASPHATSAHVLIPRPTLEHLYAAVSVDSLPSSL